MDKKSTIVFVYNADSGLINSFKDYAHKVIRPDTYSCNLCAVTFGNFGMKQEWKGFIDKLDYDVEFLHRDEFFEKYNVENENFPVAFVKKDENLTLLISHTEINKCKSLKELINLLKIKIKSI